MNIKSCFAMTISLVLIAGGCAGTRPLKAVPHHLSDGTCQALKGQEWYQKGCYQRALEHFFRAHELHASVDQINGAAKALNSIGSVYRVLGDNMSAEKFFAEAAALYQDAKDKKGARQALTNMAATLISQNLLDKAEKTLDLAEAIIISGQTRKFAPILNNRGVLFSKKGKYAEAENMLKMALNATPGSDLGGIANVNFSMGRLKLETKNFETAVKYFEKALKADRQIGFYKGIADDLSNMGEAYMGMNDAENAAKAWKRAALIYSILELPEKTSATLEKLKPAAKECDMDMFVTDFFTTRWLSGKQYENPCKR